jgi:hypothetical protein
MKLKKIIAVLIAAAAVILPLLSVCSIAMAAETPIIEEAPKNLQWPEGSLASYQCVCENDKGHEKFIYEWHIVFEGKDYKFNALNDPWCDYVDKSNSGTIGNAIFFGDINHGLNGAEVYCVVKSGNISVSTPKATIFIIEEGKFTPPSITAPVYVKCEKNDVIDLYVKGTTTAGNVSLTRDYISYHWYSTEKGTVNDMIPLETGNDIYENNVFRVDTSAAGTFYYVCGVFDGVDNYEMCNRSYTNVITVEVSEPQQTEPVTVSDPKITKQPKGGEFTIGQSCTLTVEATADKGCKLYYQWYEMLDNQSTENEIGGAVKKSFEPQQKEGDAYYRCYVYAVDGSNNISAGIPTDIVKVSYKAPETETETVTETEEQTEEITETATETEETTETEAEVTGTAGTEETESENAESLPVTADTAEETARPTEGEAQSGGSIAMTAVILLIVVIVILFTGLVALIVIIIITAKKKNK